MVYKKWRLLFPEYYLGKELILQKATKLKEQRAKEDIKNDSEYSENVILGKCGRAKLNYIKSYKRWLYAELLMNGTLNNHIAEIDKTASERVNGTIKRMTEHDNTIEELKESNHLMWVDLMNNYKHCSEGIVYNDMFFSKSIKIISFEAVVFIGIQ